MAEAPSREFDEEVKAFFAKHSYEEEVSEHFHTMEIPGLDMQEEIENASVLCLSDMPLGDEGARGFGKALSAIKPENAKDIWLTRTGIGDEGCAAVAKGVLSCPNLVKLVMMQNEIGDAGMAAVATTCKTASFTELVLSANRIGDAGIEAFAKSVDEGDSFKNLRKLYLDRNPIGDAGAVALAGVLHKLPDLEYIALYKCNIGDKGLNAFTVAINKMGALSNAEYLWMYEQDPPCSEEAIAALKFAVKGKVKSYISWPPPTPGFGYDWGKWGPQGRPLEEVEAIERNLLNPPKKSDKKK